MGWDKSFVFNKTYSLFEGHAYMFRDKILRFLQSFFNYVCFVYLLLILCFFLSPSSCLPCSLFSHSYHTDLLLNSWEIKILNRTVRMARDAGWCNFLFLLFRSDFFHFLRRLFMRMTMFKVQLNHIILFLYMKRDKLQKNSSIYLTQKVIIKLCLSFWCYNNLSKLIFKWEARKRTLASRQTSPLLTKQTLSKKMPQRRRSFRRSWLA